MSNCFLQCSLVFPERNRFDKDHSDEEALISDEQKPDDHEKDEDYRIYRCVLSIPRLYNSVRNCKRWICNMCKSKGCRKCLCCTFLLLFTIVTIITLVLFVALPLVFKYSVALQRSLIFHPVRQPSYAYNLISGSDKQNYNCNNKYTNSHVEVNKNDIITLGVWNLTCVYDSFVREYEKRIKPNLLIFHGEVGDRRSFLDGFQHLLAQFNVIAFDYRSYGDSSIAVLEEKGLVADSVSLYNWVQNHSHEDIFVLGEDLGAATATHVVSKLKDSNIVPRGLILVNSFTSLSDKIQEWFWPLGRIFSWMPWYKILITDSLEQSDLVFNTAQHIMQVDCPILITKSYHQSLPEEVASIASNRDPVTQGMVFLRQTWWSLRDTYSEDDMFLDFMDECNNFWKNKGKV